MGYESLTEYEMVFLLSCRFLLVTFFQHAHGKVQMKVLYNAWSGFAFWLFWLCFGSWCAHTLAWLWTSNNYVKLGKSKRFVRSRGIASPGSSLWTGCTAPGGKWSLQMTIFCSSEWLRPTKFCSEISARPRARIHRRSGSSRVLLLRKVIIRHIMRAGGTISAVAGHTMEVTRFVKSSGYLSPSLGINSCRI